MRNVIRLALGCLLWMSQIVLGQTLGSIAGDTRDASGGILTGASVTVTNLGTNAARTVTTNETGAYNFPSLPPGFYSVKVEKPGFRSAIRNQIELQVQQNARIDFDLQAQWNNRRHLGCEPVDEGHPAFARSPARSGPPIMAGLAPIRARSPGPACRETTEPAWVDDVPLTAGPSTCGA